MRRVLTTAIGVVIALGLVAVPAEAKTKTLKFWSKEASSKFYNADGTPATGNPGQPAAGSYFVITDDDYVGDHKKHAKRAVATDHLSCTFTGSGANASCSGEFALPGGLLYFDHAAIDFAASGNIVLPIQGGTGKYRHLKGGTVTSITYDESNDSTSDIILKLKL
jgi:hypothetical protein